MQKMDSNKRTTKGFSIMEVIIVIAIIVIMTAVLFVKNKNNGAQEVQLAAREMTAQLRLLQNEAISGKVINGQNIYKAEMSLVAGTNTYQIMYYDQSDNQIGPTDPLKPKKSKLLNTGSISFSVPLAQVSVNFGGPNGFVLRSEKDSSQEMTICVNNAGNITEKKGNDTTTCAL